MTLQEHYEELGKLLAEHPDMKDAICVMADTDGDYSPIPGGCHGYSFGLYDAGCGDFIQSEDLESADASGVPAICFWPT